MINLLVDDFTELYWRNNNPTLFDNLSYIILGFKLNILEEFLISFLILFLTIDNGASRLFDYAHYYILKF